MKRIGLFLIGFLILCNTAFAWDISSTFGNGLQGIGYSGGGEKEDHAVTESAAVSTSYSIVKKIMCGAVDQAGTLANGISRQVIKVILSGKNDSGNYVLSPTTKTGFATITFNSAGDQATLLFIDNTIGWIILGETGTTVAY